MNWSFNIQYCIDAYLKSNNMSIYNIPLQDSQHFWYSFLLKLSSYFDLEE